jgi:hypothetical protein
VDAANKENNKVPSPPLITDIMVKHDLYHDQDDPPRRSQVRQRQEASTSTQTSSAVAPPYKRLLEPLDEEEEAMEAEMPPMIAIAEDDPWLDKENGDQNRQSNTTLRPNAGTERERIPLTALEEEEIALRSAAIERLISPRRPHNRHLVNGLLPRQTPEINRMLASIRLGNTPRRSTAADAMELTSGLQTQMNQSTITVCPGSPSVRASIRREERMLAMRMSPANMDVDTAHAGLRRRRSPSPDQIAESQMLYPSAPVESTQSKTSADMMVLTPSKTPKRICRQTPRTRTRRQDTALLRSGNSTVNQTPKTEGRMTRSRTRRTDGIPEAPTSPSLRQSELKRARRA